MHVLEYLVHCFWCVYSRVSSALNCMGVCTCSGGIGAFARVSSALLHIGVCANFWCSQYIAIGESIVNGIGVCVQCAVNTLCAGACLCSHICQY